MINQILRSYPFAYPDKDGHIRHLEVITDGTLVPLAQVCLGLGLVADRQLTKLKGLGIVGLPLKLKATGRPALGLTGMDTKAWLASINSAKCGSPSTVRHFQELFPAFLDSILDERALPDNSPMPEPEPDPYTIHVDRPIGPWDNLRKVLLVDLKCNKYYANWALERDKLFLVTSHGMYGGRFSAWSLREFDSVGEDFRQWAIAFRAGHRAVSPEWLMQVDPTNPMFIRPKRNEKKFVFVNECRRWTLINRPAYEEDFVWEEAYHTTDRNYEKPLRETTRDELHEIFGEDLSKHIPRKALAYLRTLGILGQE